MVNLKGRDYLHRINQLECTWPPLAIMLTQRVEVGREECSRQDRISALKANFPSFILKTYTVLVAIFSWAISTWKKQRLKISVHSMPYLRKYRLSLRISCTCFMVTSGVHATLIWYDLHIGHTPISELKLWNEIYRKNSTMTFWLYTIKEVTDWQISLAY
jgi:hypothetical protein